MKAQHIIDLYSNAAPDDVERIAALQLALSAYLERMPSNKHFWWAASLSGVGLVFFGLSVYILFTEHDASIALLAGAILELLAAVVFLFGKDVTQPTSSHCKLETLQRYIMANSICERLDPRDRANKRVTLIDAISQSNNERLWKTVRQGERDLPNMAESVNE